MPPWCPSCHYRRKTARTTSPTHLILVTFIRLIEFLTCNSFTRFTVPQVRNPHYTVSENVLFPNVCIKPRYASAGTSFASENFPHPGALGAPYALNNFSNDVNMERLKTDRSNALSQSSTTRPDTIASFNRKRALSSSPYPDLLDVSSMIRYSPNSLYGSKNSNASGSFGHLGATTLNSVSGTNASIGTPMSISSLPTSIQHFLISGELLPSLSGHYISPANSMFSLAHHQAMSSLMQMDASMQSLKSVRIKKTLVVQLVVLRFDLSGFLRSTRHATETQFFGLQKCKQKNREQHNRNVSRSR